MKSNTDLWIMRKQYIGQYAAIIFLTYVFNIGERSLDRFQMSRQNGQISLTEMLPSKLKLRLFI